jgi:lipopolysaccharide biosynthesis regulator YciM
MMTYLLLLAALLLALLIVYQWIGKREALAESTDPFVDGLEAMVRKDWKEAARLFRSAVERNSDNIRAYEQLGRVYRELGDGQRAMKIHRELTVRHGLSDGDRARVQLELARDLRQMGRIEEALEMVSKAIRSDRRNVSSLVTQLELFESQDRWDEALDVLKKIESLSGREQNMRRGLIKVEQARVKMEEGAGRAGRVLLNEALKLNKACAAAYLLMGDSYQSEDRMEEAIQYWEQLPFEAPDHAQLVFDRLERYYFETGRFSEMENFYSRVIASKPKNTDAYIALAGFYQRKGEYDQAIRTLDEGLEKLTGNLSLSRMMVRLLARSGDTKRLCSFTIDLADRLMEESRRYRCRSCGYESSEFSFRCPKCRGWDTMGKLGDC